MGHRKYSAPRRGSIAFRPRARAKSLEPRIRTWPKFRTEKEPYLVLQALKLVKFMSYRIDDREKTPNFGKHFLNAGTVVVTPPLRVIGIRGYTHDYEGKHALFDIYAKDLPKELERKFHAHFTQEEFSKAELALNKLVQSWQWLAVSPHEVNLSQKKPFVFEVAVSGGDIKVQHDYLLGLLGKQVRAGIF